MIAEFEAIQRGADEYADDVLTNMEQQLNGMLRIIRTAATLQRTAQPQPPSPRKPYA